MTGKEHEKIAVILWVPAAAVSWIAYMNGYEDVAVGIALGAFSGFLMTPDLDVNNTTREEYRLYKIFWPLGLIWQNLWAPYGLAFAHRGWSHTPFIGTLTRIAYILGVLICGSFLANQMIVIFDFKTNIEFSASFATVFIRDNLSLCIAWYIVWALQDIGHWIADVLSTAAKREARQAIRKGERW